MDRLAAIELARVHAKARPEDYYAEPFQPHEWVIAAIQDAATPKPSRTAGVVDLMAMSVAGHLLGATALASASAADAARWHKVAAAFDGMKTSTSERFLDCLGIDGDVCKPLDVLLDAKEKGRE